MRFSDPGINVPGFPAIFRGAPDARATAINGEMILAATLALADLAKQDAPEAVYRICGLEELKFGPQYIIPKPFDPRVMSRPQLIVDEMRADTAVLPGRIEETYPFSPNRAAANVLIFPSLNGSNIDYKLLAALGGALIIRLS